MENPPTTSGAPGTAIHISRCWGSQHGGSAYSEALVRQFLDRGWNVILVAEKLNRIPGSVRTLRLPGFFRNDLRALRSRVRDILRICRLVEAVHNPLVVVQGDLPRITYLALQWVAPLMFIRQDGILTCPGNDRFLARDRTVCGHRAGLNCLLVHRKQRCMGMLPWHKQIGRTLYRLRDRLFLRSIRNFVTSSHYLARLHETKAQVLYPPCKRGSEPAPLGMNHGTAGHSPELPLNPDRDRTRLVFCGRLEPIKGGQDALRVIKLLPDRYRLEILGEGPERAALEGLVNQWHLGPRVRFHRWTPPVERDSVLASAGVLLIPSLTAEGFSMAGIEAAAQGTPVVAYRVGGIPEWCIPGAGVLVECGNVAAAAQAVKNLTDDAGRWEKYSQSARWVAEHKFPEHRFAQDVACLLKRVENMPMHSSSLCHQPAAL